jgi:hypothetical protein
LARLVSTNRRGRDLDSDNTEFLKLRLDHPLDVEACGAGFDRDGWEREED